MKTRVLLLALMLAALSHFRSKAEELMLGVGPSQATKAGFTMTLLAPRVGNEGLHPIKIQFNPLGKRFARQRDLKILLRPRDQYVGVLDYQFECRVSLPQDATTYETTVLVPHFHRWESCWMRVYEDGRPLGKTATQLNLPRPVLDWGQQVGFGIIVPRDAETRDEAWAVFPDLRSMVTVFGDGPITDQSTVKRFNEKEARDYLDRLNFGMARFRVLEENELPSSWLAYSQLDVMLAPYPVLERIAKEQPDALAPLLQWISTGGELWLYAAPQEAALANSIFRGLPPSHDGFQYRQKPSNSLTLSQENITNAIEYEPWSKSYNQGYSSSGVRRSKVYADLTKAKHPMTETFTRKQLLDQVQLAEYGRGRVALLFNEDPFPGSFQLWQGLQRQKQLWNIRHGVDYANGSDSYWAWLMAAVGGPPVTMFIIFNVIFVILIGPVLYFSLRKKRRLYLLYFLAPALAFLATSGLFTYAFVSDGFANRGRIRMLTWIDARGGADDCAIVNQSRETYYSVVDSRFGLQFDNETLALPVVFPEQTRTYNYYSANSNSPGSYRVEKNASGRRYGGDFLQTRTQTQFITVRPEKGPCPVEVDFSVNPITVTNRWDSDHKTIVVRDKNSKFWIAGPVAANEMVEMRQSDLQELTTLLQESEVLEPRLDTSTLPYRMQNAFSDKSSLEAHFGNWTENPDNGSFIIWTSVPESSFAIRNCVEEQCVRLIGGLLP